MASKFNLRLYHGHQIKYSDGVGGLTIPLNKWQAKQDQIVRADFNLMGHYHMGPCRTPEPSFRAH